MESLTKQKIVRKHRSDKEIFDAIEQFGDLSMAEFCELLEVTDSTYYNWHSKYKQMKQAEGAGSFMQLVDDFAEPDVSVNRLTAELEMPDGKVLVKTRSKGY